MRIPSSLLVALTLSLAACSGDPKTAGLEALQKGEYEKAVASLDKAFAKLDPSAPDYMEVAMSRCIALAHVDPAKAKTEFEALAASGKAGVKDFSEFVSHLINEAHYVPAIEVMDQGMKRFPEDPDMQQIRDNVVAKSKAANDPAANATLKGLGYLGGD